MCACVYWMSAPHLGEYERNRAWSYLHAGRFWFCCVVCILYSVINSMVMLCVLLLWRALLLFLQSETETRSKHTMITYGVHGMDVTMTVMVWFIYFWLAILLYFIPIFFQFHVTSFSCFDFFFLLFWNWCGEFIRFSRLAFCGFE